ncbi:PREDICTED: 2'-5'-oligoadenylate synthase 1-like [Chinchilla lanigera]|uniref:2'-5'-oligoadenylate synthetase 1 n=1 Tax=Chinchilla lanigera TaxID=34839 RepID=A0A8C2VS72_CHILA|nr:PREDICTED: 2'-5'-oligoadenylate synthase 1-like [Chinchilla lanigera]
MRKASGPQKHSCSHLRHSAPSPHLTAAMDLRNTLAENLNKFIKDHLLLDYNFHEDVKNAIEQISEFLKERCLFPGAPIPVRVSKVVRGGFSGRDATLRDQCDADLVIFLTNLKSFQEQVSRREEFIREIRQDLEEFQRCTRTQIFEINIKDQDPSNPCVLSFELSSSRFPGRTVKFNVLPAFNALGQVTKAYRPDPEVYIGLIHECTSKQTEGEFSTCFTELQRAFVKQRPTKVKSLIRLVKHWYQLCKEELGGPLPPQYALELLTIHAWESGSGRTSFNTAQGFKTVLELVTGYQQLCVYWTEYYDFENPIITDYLNGQLRKRRPVILDPVDPTRNLGGEDPECWRRLAQAAEAWLSYPCFEGRDGSRLESWGCTRRKQTMKTRERSGRRRVSARIQDPTSSRAPPLRKRRKPGLPPSCDCLAYEQLKGGQ